MRVLFTFLIWLFCCYLVYWYFTFFLSGVDWVIFFYGSIVHVFVLVCRYMAGLCGVLDWSVDVSIVKVFLGVVEYFY